MNTTQITVPIENSIECLLFLDGYNFEKTDELIRETSKETVVKICREFRKSLIVGIRRLRDNLNVPQREMIFQTCHKLLGTSEMLGFEGLSSELRVFTSGVVFTDEKTRVILLQLIGICERVLTQLNKIEE